MAGTKKARGPRRLVKALSALLVLVLLAGAVVAWRTGKAEEWWDQIRSADGPGSEDPAAVALPPQVPERAVAEPAALAKPADGSARLDRSALADALRALKNPDLGAHVLAAVGPIEGKGYSYRLKGGSPLAIPASTTKLVTSTAALFLLGPERTFETTAVLDRSTKTPRLVLVGGGDPFLARTPERDDPTDGTYQPNRANLRTLARRTAKALRNDGVTRVRLGYDDTLFSGPAVHPSWEPGYVPEETPPISALWVDEGRDADGRRQAGDPALAAVAAFRQQMVKAGIAVSGAAARVRAPSGHTPVGVVTSPTLAQIVQRLLEVSDNAAAEVLLRQAGLADQGEGSFEAGQRAVRRVLGANGVRLGSSVLYDGSGLSRANRLAPSVLVSVLRLAASDDHPELRPVLAALPVTGFTGSLTNRMDGGPAMSLGRVRAKTGTLSNVSSLAGIAIDKDGDLMAFALMADRIKKPKSLLARVAMDNAAAALGACACGG
ncbi:MAG: D-alanyl-D-alanine carboxypeptidase/D-alanyl-D-alanine-endopeptidase [Nocardioidaceae bacterium]|nr:D-alanyl-D-alanine carboxypeptidase/D-alanyl-D-alanine-endopeptidase [Nocardioidaceae bacterium]